MTPGGRSPDVAACGSRTSVTAGTIFDRTRTPLTVWFTACCWLFATGKDGISALSLKRTLEIGSYQTAWTMLHRLRAVLVRPGRDRLAGKVDVDETYIGGEEPGLCGGGAQGKKVLTGVAVEVREPKGMGRCRIWPMHRPPRCPVRDGSRRTKHDGHHRRLAGLQRNRETRLRPRQAQGAASEPPSPAASRPARCFRRCMRSAPWPNGGCSARIRARRNRRTWPATSTSSCSVSTAADPGAGGWCSFVCLNWRSPTPRCAINTSSPGADRAKSRRRLRRCAVHPPSLERPPANRRGEPLCPATPLKWIPQRLLIYLGFAEAIAMIFNGNWLLWGITMMFLLGLYIWQCWPRPRKHVVDACPYAFSPLGEPAKRDGNQRWQATLVATQSE